MAVLALMLLLPAGFAAVWFWLDRTWTAGLLLVGGLVPPVWFAVLFARVLNGADIDGSAAVPPILLGAVEVVALWIAWYQRDPKGAGQALAVAEGAAAVYHVKHDRPVLGAVTGVSAVDQWQRSSAHSGKQARPAAAPSGLIPAGSPLAQALGQLALSHAKGDLSDEAFALARQRLLNPAPSASTQVQPPGSAER